MLLAGRDTATGVGDDTPNGTVSTFGGTVDLDGTSNDREAIIQNSSGNALFLRSTVDASQGLTKGGNDGVYLDMPNNIGGTVTIAQSTLYARDNRALGNASLVRAEGDGYLILENQVAITNVDIVAGERYAGTPVLQSARPQRLRRRHPDRERGTHQRHHPARDPDPRRGQRAERHADAAGRHRHHGVWDVIGLLPQ